MSKNVFSNNGQEVYGKKISASELCANCSEKEFEVMFNKTSNADESFLLLTLDDGVSIPNNLAPIIIEWEKSDNNLWLVILEFPDGNFYVSLTKDNFWKPSPENWDKIKSSLPEKYGEFTVYGYNGKFITKSNTAKIRVSKYDADQFIVYRHAQYPFNFNTQKPPIYYRDISQDSPEKLLEANFCFSCHTFSSSNEKAIISTRESPKENDVLLIDTQTESSFNINNSGNTDLKGSLLGTWAPGEDKVIINVNLSKAPRYQDYFNTADVNYNESDLAIYELSSKKLYALPGASIANVIEIYPTMSPDGKTIAFAKLDVSKDLSGNEHSDIYVVPFNDGKGGIAKPLTGASEEFAREYLPKYSPDGKWLIYNRVNGKGDAFAENSDLYIIAAEGGVPHYLECNDDEVMDSNADWSSNSKWIAFTTRRYHNESRTYLAEIDENGHAYPAIKIPMVENESDIGDHQPRFVKNKRNLLEIKKIFDMANL